MVQQTTVAAVAWTEGVGQLFDDLLNSKMDKAYIAPYLHPSHMSECSQIEEDDADLRQSDRQCVLWAVSSRVERQWLQVASQNTRRHNSRVGTSPCPKPVLLLTDRYPDETPNGSLDCCQLRKHGWVSVYRLTQSNIDRHAQGE